MLDLTPTRLPPHVHTWPTTARAIWLCTISLLPVVLWSSLLFGWPAVFVWASAVGSAYLTEVLASLARRQPLPSDGSAVLTGLLIAAALPATVPLYVPILSAAFAILIVKQCFGGLGSNWMNPAMAGIAFAYINWPQALLVYTRGLPADAQSAATPIAMAQSGAMPADISAYFGGVADQFSAFDQAASAFLNTFLFNPLNARLPEGYIDYLFGFQATTLGESALFFIIVGSVLLIALKLIKLEIPLAMLGAYVVLVRLFGTGLLESGFGQGDVLLGLSAGGVLFCAFYYATDPVTSPIGRRGMLVYGLILGGLFYLFTRWKTYIEGAAFAILIANCLVATIDRIDSLRMQGRRLRMQGQRLRVHGRREAVR